MPETRFHIERLTDVNYLDKRGAHREQAWLPIDHIEWEGDRYAYRDAFTAWISEQDPEPSFGTYRVICSSNFDWSFRSFAIREHRERVIEPVEHAQVARDIETLSRAALSPMPGVESS